MLGLTQQQSSVTLEFLNQASLSACIWKDFSNYLDITLKKAEEIPHVVPAVSKINIRKLP